jgi:hypothetical protein
MKRILARCAPLVRCLHIRRNHRITNSALALPLERTLDISPKGEQAIHEVAIGEHDYTLDDEHPAAPFLFVDEYAAAAGHDCGL